MKHTVIAIVDPYKAEKCAKVMKPVNPHNFSFSVKSNVAPQECYAWLNENVGPNPCQYGTPPWAWSFEGVIQQ